MAAAADAGDATHNFVVKRTFIDVVEAPPSPSGGTGMRRRCCSDPGAGECVGEEGSVEFDLCGLSDCGMSDTETLVGNEDTELPCYARVRYATQPAATPPGADAAAGPAAPPAREAASWQLASENARLQAENQLLRECCSQAVPYGAGQWGAMQWGGEWGGAMVQMPVGYVSIPICAAQLPVDDARLGARGSSSDSPAGSQANPPQPQKQQQQRQRGGRTVQTHVEDQSLGPILPEHQEADPTRTTVMLRNMPNNYTRDMVVSMLDKEGFAKQYDFVYLPIDFKTRACLGYAFINLVDVDIVPRFWRTFDGYSNWILPSRKLCHISWSEPHQGLEMHLDRYRNSPIMHATVPDEHRPVVFRDGVRVPFPEPTKAMRAPRPRPSMAPKEHPARQVGRAAGKLGRDAGGGGRGAGARGSAVRGGQR